MRNKRMTNPVRLSSNIAHEKSIVACDKAFGGILLVGAILDPSWRAEPCHAACPILGGQSVGTFSSPSFTTCTENFTMAALERSWSGFSTVVDSPSRPSGPLA